MARHPIIDRISPFWLGIGISGSLLLLMFLIAMVTGRWHGLMTGGEFDPLARVPEGMLRDTRIAIVHCLSAGYLSAALLYVMRSSRHTVMVLQQVLDCTREECGKLAKTVRLSTRNLVIIGLVAFTLALLIPYVVPPVPVTPWNPMTWSPEVAWARILGPLTMVLAWWLAYAIVSVSMRMSRIAKSLAKIDLLNLSPLEPFTQQGLTNALVQIGSLSIWSLMMIETGFGHIMLVIGGATLAGTAYALLAPVHGLHQRIRQSKEEVLGWVNAELAAEQRGFHAPRTGQESGRMADLVAYRGMIESVPEWPFTLSTYTRGALYALLPIISWGIGLVAEEFLSRFFY